MPFFISLDGREEVWPVFESRMFYISVRSAMMETERLLMQWRRKIKLASPFFTIV